jgi:IMP dehydrogenase
MTDRPPFPDKLSSISTALTYDDVSLEPGASGVLPVDVDVSARLGNIEMAIPLLAAAMDTVSDGELPVAWARQGGVAIRHRKDSIKVRAEKIRADKRQQSGVIYDPITIDLQFIVAQGAALMEENSISSLPVIDDDKKVVGMFTEKDSRAALGPAEPINQYMTPLDALAIVDSKSGWTPAQYTEIAEEIMDKGRVNQLPIIRADGTLEGLITRADIEKVKKYPNACRDDIGRLRIGVAVGPKEIEQVPLLLEAGADIICIDTAHGHHADVVLATRQLYDLKQKRDFVLMAGNIATREAAIALVEAGADAIKVGIGAGSICTTRIVTGVGVPMITAIQNVAGAVYEVGSDAVVVADGGMRYSGDVAKALAAGAHIVMVGSLAAGVKEAPGETFTTPEGEFVAYRGMGSEAVMKEAGGDRYFQRDPKQKFVPEGIEGAVPFRGYLEDHLYQLVGGVRQCMGYVGAPNLQELRKKSRFVRVTEAGKTEAHPHSLAMMRGAANYGPKR